MGSEPPSLSVAVFILHGMESASFGFAGHPVVAALDAVSDALDKAATVDVWSLSDDDLSATTEWCERLAALALRLVREVDARDLGRRLGALSTAAWLAGRLRLRPGEAKTRVSWRTGSTRMRPTGRWTTPP